MTITFQSVPVSKIWLDTENPRHDILQAQRDIINWMVEKRGDQVFNLAKDIATKGLSPLERILLVFGEEDGEFTVKEGNRRLTCLKVLGNPSLIDDPALRKRFEKIQILKPLPLALDCAVSGDPEEVHDLMNSRHMGEDDGRGLMTWGAWEKSEFSKRTRGKNRYWKATALVEYAIGSGLITAEDRDSLDLTTIERIISDTNVQDFLGIQFVGEIGHFLIDPLESDKGILHILKGLVAKKIKVDDVKVRGDRIKFLEAFPTETVPDKSRTRPQSISFAETARDKQGSSSKDKSEPNGRAGGHPTDGGQIKADEEVPSRGLSPMAAGKRKRSAQDPKNRKCLIARIMKIGHKKINRLYWELKSLNVQEYPLCAGGAVRAFVELSTDQFITRKGITLMKGKDYLAEKIKACGERLHADGQLDLDAFENLKRAMNDKDAHGNPRGLHAYLHNEHEVGAEKLIDRWDSVYEHYVAAIWLSLE